MKKVDWYLVQHEHINVEKIDALYEVHPLLVESRPIVRRITEVDVGTIFDEMAVSIEK